MITCTAVQHVKPGREAEVERLMQALVHDVRAHEPGCSIFEFVRSQTEPGTYLVIEQYADEETFARHRQTEYLQRMLPRLLDCLETAPDLATYESVGERPAQEERRHV